MKVKYTGSHSRYTVADITFKKDEVVELADDQVAKIKVNGVGARLFANGDLVADKSPAKATTKTVVNPDLTSAPKAADKTEKAAKPETKVDAKTAK